MSDTYEPITPEGVEQKPAASIPVHDSEKILQQLPPGPERQAILGEVEPGEPLTIEGAARQLRNRRGEQPASGVDFKVDGRTTTRPQSDREAARDLTFAKRVDHVSRIMEALPRVNVETAGATAGAAEKGGHIHEFKLDDKDRADPLSHGDDLKTAQQRLSSLREQRATDLHAIAEQLSQSPEGQLYDPEGHSAVLQAQQQQSEPQPPDQQQPQQPDHVEQLRLQAEAEKTAYQQMRQATAVEQQLHNTAQWLDQEVTKRYAGQIQAAGSLEAFAKANPAGFKELAEAKQYFDTCQANIQHCRQIELLNQQKAAELQQAKMRQEHAAWAQQQDDEVTKRIPELANPETAPALQRAALDTLKGAGITEQELRSLWNGEQTLNLRDHRAQTIISKAAKWDAAQAKAHAARPEPLPAVFRPGVGTTKAERSAADQSAQLGQLGYLSPEQAMRQGAKLLAQRRGSR